MFDYIKSKWLWLWLQLRKFFGKMVVTQHEIDAAIAKAEKTQRELYLSIETRLRAGYLISGKELSEYESLRNSIFLLTNSTKFLEENCITEEEVWLQIQYVNENSFIC